MTTTTTGFVEEETSLFCSCSLVAVGVADEVDEDDDDDDVDDVVVVVVSPPPIAVDDD